MKKFIKVLEILSYFGYTWNLILEDNQIRIEIMANVTPSGDKYVNWVIVKNGIILIGAKNSGFSHKMKVSEFNEYVSGIHMCLNSKND